MVSRSTIAAVAWYASTPSLLVCRKSASDNESGELGRLVSG